MPKLPTPTITKAEARAFRERWRLVNAREEEELRSTPIEVKWRQFNSLMRMGRQLGWFDCPREDDAEVRERWARIRKACCVPRKPAKRKK